MFPVSKLKGSVLHFSDTFREQEWITEWETSSSCVQTPLSAIFFDVVWSERNANHISRRISICQSVAEVYLTGMIPLGAIRNRFNFFRCIDKGFCFLDSVAKNKQNLHIHKVPNILFSATWRLWTRNCCMELVYTRSHITSGTNLTQNKTKKLYQN